MKRHTIPEDPHWKGKCVELGFSFCGTTDDPYWAQNAGYEFSAEEIDLIEAATQDAHDMCMDFVADVVKAGDYPSGFGLSDEAKTLVEKAWRNHHQHLYGRFDLAFVPGTQPKILEYNADTPTALYEAAVVQWHWMNMHSKSDQFNSIHESLIERWKQISAWLGTNGVHSILDFAAMRDSGEEDWGTVNYLMDTALQAGLACDKLPLEDIGWNGSDQNFQRQDGRAIDALFTLYPKEWMVRDEFAAHIRESQTFFIEPFWKMLLSNKALLPELWKRHPNHPILLPAYYQSDEHPACKKGVWARKPILSREGANVSKIIDSVQYNVSGATHNISYALEPHVLQLWHELPVFDGKRPVIGSWVIGDKAAGIGIRESAEEVTGNMSQFVPHWFS